MQTELDPNLFREFLTAASQTTTSEVGPHQLFANLFLKHEPPEDHVQLSKPVLPDNLAEPEADPIVPQALLNDAYIARPFSGSLPSLSPLGSLGQQWGRDDIKRAEPGESGQLVKVAVGRALGHMVGLADEEPGHRNGEKLEGADNSPPPSIALQVGTGLVHLGGLGDFDYARASGEMTDNPFGTDSGRKIYEPLIKGALSFELVEDNLFAARIFDSNLAGRPAGDIAAVMNPAEGSVVLKPDGSFVYTPPPGFSGKSSFQFTFHDPRTGFPVSGEVRLTVEAVADPVSIAGAATGNEDSTIAWPITIDLQDLDGSEEIERVVISGVPTGATLHWDTTLPGTVQVSGDAYSIEGSETQIRAIAATLALTPPLNFSGRISLGLAVTTVEAHADPLVPGFMDREVTSAAYIVDVTPVADRPDVATRGMYSTAEDTAVALHGLSGSLVDKDGSEVLAFQVTGVPAGASFASGTPLGGGVWSFTSAQIVAGLTFNPPPNVSGTYDMALLAIATEQANLDWAVNSAPFQVVIVAVPDALDLTTSPATGPEDTAILFGVKVGIAINDPDGSEVLTRIVVSGVPAGATVDWNHTVSGGSVTALGGGSYEITGSEAAIRALLAGLTLTPPLHDSRDITLTYDVSSEDAGVAHSETILQSIIVTPVADIPTATGGVYSTEEDTPVLLAGAGGALVDADGSEVLAFRITGVPAGGSFNTGTNSGGGVWAFTPAQIAAGLTFSPPTQAHATYDMTLVSIATESENGDAAQNSAGIRVIVDAQADSPFASTHPAIGIEDTSILFGNQVSIALADTDGSERLDQVTISGLPSGATLTWNSGFGGTVSGTGSGPYTLSGSEAEIRALLTTLGYQPPHNDDTNVSLSISVLTRDADGSTATTTIIQPIVVESVADVPGGHGAGTGNEDSIILVPIAVSLSDIDGSETIAYVDVTGIPVGSVVSWSNASGTVTPITDGLRVTGTTAEIQSRLMSLRIQPPLNSDGDFTLAVVVRAIESAPTNGEVNLLTADFAFKVTVAVAAVADQPTAIGGTYATEEDTAVLLNGVGGALFDTDGSEALTFRITGVASGASFNAGTNLGSGVWSFTPAQVSAGLSYTPPSNQNGTFDMTLVSNAREAENGDVAQNTAAIRIVVDAQADAPPVSTNPVTGNEDTAILFGNQVSMAVADTDGSERIETVTISGLPAGATLTWNTSLGGVVSGSGSGPYVFSGTEAQIRNLIATAAYQAPHNDDTNVSLSIIVGTIDTDGSRATTTIAQPIVVQAVADMPSGSGAGSGTEDTVIAVPIAVSLSDTDGSETIQFVDVTGFPAGSTVSWTSAAGTATAMVGGYRIEGTTADIQARMLSMQVQPPHDSDVNFNLSVTVGAIESNPTNGEFATLTASTSFTVAVNVIAAADQPTAAGGTFATEEDTSVGLTGIGGALVDTDGSETLSFRITSVPTGATFNTGTNLGGGIWSFTPSQIAAGLSFTPPANQHGTFDMTLVSSATETENGSVAQNSALIRVVVDAQADGASVVAAVASGNEDQPIAFGNQIAWTLLDSDGSEAVSEVVVAAVPVGWTVNYSASGAASVTVLADGFKINGTASDIRATLSTFTIQAPLNRDEDTALAITVTTTDADGSTKAVTTTQNVSVNAIADTPAVTGGSYATNEDVAVPLTGIGGGLTDADGSETLTFRISSVPAGASFNTGTNQGSGVWTFTSAQVVGGISFNPPPQANGTYVMALQSIATEHTVAGEPTSDDIATSDTTITVVVNQVIDPIIVGGSNSTTNEDTYFNLGQNLGLSLVDTDGSQNLSVILSGIPSAVSTKWTNQTGVTVTSVGGVYTISGANAATVLTVVNSFQARPPANSDANFTVTVDTQTVETGGATSTTSATHDVIVRAVADKPTVAISGSGNEDTFIAVPVTVSLTDTDGSETLQQVRISGVPTETNGLGSAIHLVNGAGQLTLAGNFNGTQSATDLLGNAYTIVGNGSGQFTFTGTSEAIRNSVASLEVRRGDHVGNDFTLSVVATSIESNPTLPDGEIQTLTASNTAKTYTVNVVPITDAVTAIAPTTLDTEEDNGIRLSTAGFGATQVDADGSETLSYRFSNLPAGIVFKDGSGNTIGTDAGGGVWTLTAAEFAQARLIPSPHLTSSYSIDFTAITNESEGTSSPQTDTKSITIMVAPNPDPPAVTGSSTVIEDETVNFGQNISYALVDQDGSEQIVQVDISNIPAGWTVSFAGGTMPTNVTLSAGTYAITGTQAEIRSAVDTFRITPPLNYDGNTDPALPDASITVSVTTQDTHDPIFGNGDQATTSYQFPIEVLAAADAPIAVAAAVNGIEDTAFKLWPGGTGVTAGLNDADGSESLSAVLTGVPLSWAVSASTTDGGTYTRNGDGSLSISGTPIQINAILASIEVQAPLNWSGVVPGAQLSVTATEAATGSEVATTAATSVATFDIVVAAVADAPTVRVLQATGGQAGYEDTPIRIEFQTQIVDSDGSEAISHEVRGLPLGAQFVNVAGQPIGTAVDTNGDAITDAWRFTAAEVAQLHVLPELNSNLDFTLEVRALSIESNVAPSLPGYGDVAYSTWVPLEVEVIGVADQVIPTITQTFSPEDQRFPIGQAISGALVDVDVPQEAQNSETLYFVIVGLPSNIVPTHATYIGIGWQVAAAELPLVTLPVPANFSGDYLTIAPNLTIRTVTQENDRNQTYCERVILPGELILHPVADGFSSWSPAVQVNEDQPISLANIGNNTLSDADGSETVVSYRIDLTHLIADAQIGGRLDELIGPGATLDDFLANYVNGSFTNNGDGTITVTPAQLSDLSFSSAPFLDSNVDFALPVTAIVRDTAGTLASEITQTHSFTVNLVGQVDTPTAHTLAAYEGNSGALIALNPGGHDFGGNSTDRDEALGRILSESPASGGDIYYVVSNLDPALALVDGNGDPIGQNNNDGSWLLRAADLANLYIVSAPGFSGTVTLALTTVVTENDGSQAQTSTPALFNVTFHVGSGGTGGFDVDPLPALITIGPAMAGEDGALALNIQLAFDPAERLELKPIITVLFDDIPAGFTIAGATFNPVNGKWVASEAEVEAGHVKLIPPHDYSGPLPVGLTVQAISSNNQFRSVTTGEILFDGSASAPLPEWSPVADGPSISMTWGTAVEDQAIALIISVAPRDTDVSSQEAIVEPILVQVPVGYSLSAGTPTGTPGEFSLTAAQTAGLTLIPPAIPTHHHDVPIPVTVTASTNEPGTAATQSQTFNITMVAAADAPLATAANATGSEDSVISLAGLSAALVDTDGSEILSAKITGIPESSLLSAGGNNGDGSWTIPIAALASLSLTPPKDFSGVLHLSLQVYSLETSNGDVAITSVPFDVTVGGVADRVNINPQTVAMHEGQSVVLDLRVVLEDRTVSPESVEITFTAVPTGSYFSGSAGGLLENIGSGSWRFTGTQAQAEAISFAPAAYLSGDFSIGISAVALDGDSRGTPTSALLLVSVEAVADQPVLDVNPASGPVDLPIPLNIYASFPDNDGSETHLIEISGVPTGATFNSGIDDGAGNWHFIPAQLAGLTLTVADGTPDFTLAVTASATEVSNQNVASMTSTIAVSIGTAGVTINGTAGADLLSGGVGDDTIFGGAGADVATGSGGSDTFGWHLADAGTGADHITDFTMGLGGDKLDLSALLSNFHDGVDDLSKFINVTEAAGSTTISVDTTGSSSFSELVVLDNASVADLNALRANGNLVV